MPVNPEILSACVAVLGEDFGGNDVEEINEVFLGDKVGSGTYTEEVFKAHLEAINESGDQYIGFIKNMSTDPSMKTMYAFILSAGPDAVYGLLSQMGQAGLLKKSKVASAAKITTKKAATRDWFRQIWDELSKVAYTAISDSFESNLEEYRKRFPEIDSEDIKTFKDLLIACEKSTLFAGVDKATQGKTDKECSLALGFRNDVHSAARNGGWDPKKGEYTQKYHEEQAAKAAGEDTSDEDSADEASESK